MNIYEITFITREDKNQAVQKLIQQFQGKILSEKSLSRKKFTYRIKKENAGFYTTVIFELESDKLKEMDRDLKINPEILRYLIISWQKEFSSKELPSKLAELQTLPLEEAKKKKSEEKGVRVEPKAAEKEVIKEKGIPQTKTEKVKIKEQKPSEMETKITAEQEKEKTEEEIKKKEEKKEEKSKVIIPESKKEAVSEEERLAKLEEKLNELLKD